MKKIIAGLGLFASTSQLALAQCYLNGEEIPCSEMPGWFWGFMIGMPILGILFFIFWLVMLIDAIKNQKENKLMWILLIVLLNVLGAIIYYFVEKRKRKKTATI